MASSARRWIALLVSMMSAPPCAQVHAGAHAWVQVDECASGWESELVGAYL